MCGKAGGDIGIILGTDRESDVDLHRRIALNPDAPAGLAQMPVCSFNIARHLPVGAEAQTGFAAFFALYCDALGRDRSRGDQTGGNLCVFRCR